MYRTVVNKKKFFEIIPVLFSKLQILGYLMKYSITDELSVNDVSHASMWATQACGQSQV
jgi:hypothetical protein